MDMYLCNQLRKLTVLAYGPKGDETEVLLKRSNERLEDKYRLRCMCLIFYDAGEIICPTVVISADAIWTHSILSSVSMHPCLRWRCWGD